MESFPDIEVDQANDEKKQKSIRSPSFSEENAQKQPHSTDMQQDSDAKKENIGQKEPQPQKEGENAPTSSNSEQGEQNQRNRNLTLTTFEGITFRRNSSLFILVLVSILICHCPFCSRSPS